ncbi:MAG: NAD(P)-dependent oxidoreductase [Actinomycetota bacterium]|nr:NAD(P)-dependent oxidoreductase [Actinomycetota bacterium]
MLSGEKILVTGAAGQIGLPLATHLATGNEVWGLARFSDPAARARLEAVGVKPFRHELGIDDPADLPEDFTYVIHLAAHMAGDDYDHAITVNAEGTGLLLERCRRAKAALVMSTHSVYKPQADPRHVFVETDPLGDVNSTVTPTYSVSKIAQEAVARYCSRAFDLPVVIARMNASYGPNGGLPAYHLDAVAQGQPITTRWDPCMYSPIYEDDINEQAGLLLEAATVPATIVNWAGDEPVSVQEWAVIMGELAGRPAEVVVTEIPNTLRGSVADVSRRRAATGPCRIGIREGLRRTWDSRRATSPEA